MKRESLGRGGGKVYDLESRSGRAKARSTASQPDADMDGMRSK